MRQVLTILLTTALCCSCNFVGDKTKKAINKTGEVIGEGASEFGKGVKSGVENALECEVALSDALLQKGISLGKYNITGKASDSQNRLTVYLIFEKDFSGTISARVFDKENKEYGRTSVSMTAKKGEAKFADFDFDPRTNVESKSRFILE